MKKENWKNNGDIVEDYCSADTMEMLTNLGCPNDLPMALSLYQASKFLMRQHRIHPTVRIIQDNPYLVFKISITLTTEDGEYVEEYLGDVKFVDYPAALEHSIRTACKCLSDGTFADIYAKHSIIKKLKASLSEVEEGWDGAAGKKPFPETLYTTVELLKGYTLEELQRTSVFPANDGGVYIQRKEISVYVYKNSWVTREKQEKGPN